MCLGWGSSLGVLASDSSSLPSISLVLQLGCDTSSSPLPGEGKVAFNPNGRNAQLSYINYDDDDDDTMTCIQWICIACTFIMQK